MCIVGEFYYFLFRCEFDGYVVLLMFVKLLKIVVFIFGWYLCDCCIGYVVIFYCVFLWVWCDYDEVMVFEYIEVCFFYCDVGYSCLIFCVVLLMIVVILCSILGVMLLVVSWFCNIVCRLFIEWWIGVLLVLVCMVFIFDRWVNSVVILVVLVVSLVVFVLVIVNDFLVLLVVVIIRFMLLSRVSVG